MIDPSFAYKIISLIMESSVSALVAGLLIGGFSGACIMKIAAEKKNDCGENVEN